MLAQPLSVRSEVAHTQCTPTLWSTFTQATLSYVPAVQIFLDNRVIMAQEMSRQADGKASSGHTLNASVFIQVAL